MIIRLTYLWFYNRPVRKFVAGAARCREVQRDVLLAKLGRHAVSDFGRRHGFASIRSVADFRRQVPVTTYDYYAPYLECAKRGDLGALFGPGTRLRMFALTSGTTSESKFIPVTQESFKDYCRGWNVWIAKTFRDHPDLCVKRVLHVASDWRKFTTEGGVPCGNISGLAAEAAPAIRRLYYVLPPAVAKIDDPVAKRYAALRLAIASRRVGLVITANPSTLVEYSRLVNAERESLIRDLFDGTLSDEYAIPAAVRDQLRSRLEPKPDRARELEQIVQRTGTLYPRDFWEDLSVLAVWMGGSVGAYLPRLREFFGDVHFRDHGLSASEGRMTLPLTDGTSAGMLDYTHQFFEFIPEEEHDRPQPTVLEAHELEPDRNYFILLTTSGGLYRYDIHDLVRCVGFQGSTPILEFLNKGAYISSVTGEKLSEFQVVEAVKRGFAELAVPLETFTVAPMFSDPPGYVLLLEPAPGRPSDAALARRINAELARLNCEYAERLESGRLLPLAIRAVPRGIWHAFRARRIDRLGGSLEQYKHPCLVNRLDFVEQLLGEPNIAAESVPELRHG